MEEINEVNLQKLYPHFSSPDSSRFSELFKEISEENKTESSKKYLIIPKRIIDGTEKRTSIIIKGIPSAFGCQNFYELLIHFSNDIRFFYIPAYAVNKWKYIYAFVSFVSQKGVLNIFEGLSTMRDKYKSYNGFDFSKIEIYFCKSQNINGLIRKYQKDTYQSNFLVCK